MSHLGLLVCALLLAHPPTELLTLEIRVFAGTEDVTGETRVTVHRAGERGQPVGRVAAIEPRVLVKVPPGIYDVQAVRERDGRVLNIRWAQRLVVMPYPDEAGHHLEVINFTTGFGALQIRPQTERAAAALSVALFSEGSHDQAIAAAPGDGYTLYVVPAGLYDIQVTRNNRSTRHKAVEVPLDRTRLWIVP
ncbi:MAG: hypothetical protein ACRD1U_06915 [Vicinamibacterales bacterium]